MMLGQICTRLLVCQVLSDTQTAQAEDTGKRILQQYADKKQEKRAQDGPGAAGGGRGECVHTCYSAQFSPVQS